MSDWRSDLAQAREQRADRNPRRLAWDAKWRDWWEIHVGRGGTPNAAVSFAYRKTTDLLGRRPGNGPTSGGA